MVCDNLRLGWTYDGSGKISEKRSPQQFRKTGTPYKQDKAFAGFFFLCLIKQ